LSVDVTTALGYTPVTTAGYNKSNWDAAYGWGNHAGAGYIISTGGVMSGNLQMYGEAMIGYGVGGNGVYSHYNNSTESLHFRNSATAGNILILGRSGIVTAPGQIITSPGTAYNHVVTLAQLDTKANLNGSNASGTW